MICRDENRGLGIQSLEFYQHFKPHKTLVLEFANERNHPERYRDARFTLNSIKQPDIDWLLDGVDMILGFETFYNNDLMWQAKKRNIKTVLQVNWEWWEGQRPDLIIAPSLWHWSNLPEPKEYLPVPVNREKLPFKLREKAKTFLFNAGNSLGGYDRNGTDVFMDAIKFIKSNIKIIIKSQIPLQKKVDDKRIEYIEKDERDYWKGWPEADILVYPRRYGGLSLILNEAMSLGMVPLMTNMAPQDAFLPEELLIKIESSSYKRVKQIVEVAEIKPEEVAKKIDEIAGKDIRGFSNLVSNRITKSWSWDRLKDKYLKIFKKVENNKK